MMSSILKVKDKDGNWIDITAIKGEDGKSAYEQAKEGGFTGTEEEFIAFLNGLLNPVSVIDDTSEDHIADKNNPHNVTAEQVGAFSINGGTIQGDVNLFSSHHPTLKAGVDTLNTSSLLYTPNKTVDVYNWTNGEPTTISLGNVNSMLLRDVFKLWVGAKDYQIYGDHNASELGIARVATGSYVGTGVGGQANPSVLIFPFQPKVVFISLKGQTNRCDATLPLMYGSGIGLVYSATSSNWSTHSTYPINLVWEGNKLYWTYTLNTTSVEQKQLNISDLPYDWFIWG
jgi:hypothetical protein